MTLPHSEGLSADLGIETEQQVAWFKVQTADGEVLEACL